MSNDIYMFIKLLLILSVVHFCACSPFISLLSSSQEPKIIKEHSKEHSDFALLVLRPSVATLLSGPHGKFDYYEEDPADIAADLYSKSS